MSISGRYDDENLIIKDMHELWRNRTACFLTESELEFQLYETIMNNWDKWTINNAHDAPPPDYFSDDFKLAFDVMRVFDSEIEVECPNGEKKFTNPPLAKEGKMFRQCLRNNPNIKPEQIRIAFAPDKEHYYETYTYNKYCNHVKRVLHDHLESLNICRTLHPEHKIGFFVFDNTAIYIQHTNLSDAQGPVDPNKRYLLNPIPHIPFLDKNMVSELFSSNLDFLIWLSPYKYNRVTYIQIPTITFIDLTNKNKIDLIQYPSELMRCT